MTDVVALTDLIADITVDCHDEDEQIAAFHAVFAQEVGLPTDALLLGMLVAVRDFDVRESGRELIAHCRGVAGEQDIALADLVFPPDTEAGWLHAAYRRFLGLSPHPADVPPGWLPSW